jgi:hypothetical protein
LIACAKAARAARNEATDRIEFDTLCEKVSASMPEVWVTFAAPNS